MHQSALPFSGRSATARACSLRGANDAAKRRAEKSLRVLDYLARAGERGLTRWDLQAVTGYAISSLCSIIDALKSAGLVVEAGERITGPYRKAGTVYRRAA